jgi:hypothetical protein
MVRRAAGILAAAAMLAACTGGGSHPPSTGTSGAAPLLSSTGPPTALATGTAGLSANCAKLATTAAKISEAELALYTGGSSTAVSTLTTELKSLQSVAPAQLRPAIDDLINGFAIAADVLAHPTNENKAQLAALSARLSTDGKQVSDYVVAQCPQK